MSVCTCAPCGRTFTGLTAFDKHQDVDYSRRPVVVCRDPATVGLVRQQSGRWGLPPDARSRARLAKIRAEQPRTRTPGTPGDPEPAETRPQP